MAVNLSPVGGVAAQFFDNDGNVLSGGKIYTYVAGTSTPTPTYTTAAGNIAHSNPIVLDSGGRVPTGEIWLTDGVLYKFVLKDSGDALIATYDNISGINSNAVAYTNQQEIITATAGQTVFDLTITYAPGTNSLSVFVDGVNQYGPGAQYAYTETDGNTVTFNSGLHVGAEVKFTSTQQQGAGSVDASQVSYNPPFTDSVPTNVEAKLAQYVSVLDFGASVSETAANNTTFINNAIEYAALNNLNVDLVGGVYAIQNIRIKNGLRSFGNGTLVPDATYGNGIIEFDGGTLGGTAVDGCTIYDLKVNCAAAQTVGGSVIIAHAPTNCSFLNNNFYNVDKINGFALVNGAGQNRLIGNRFQGTYFQDSGVGINISTASVDGYWGYFSNANGTTTMPVDYNYNNVIANNFIFGGQQGIYLAGCERTVVSGNVIMSPQDRCINMACARHGSITGNTCQLYGSSGIHLSYGSTYNEVSGNSVSSTVSDGEAGIQCYVGSGYNNITGNVVDSDAQFGIYVAVSSSYNNISGNSIKNYVRAGIGVDSDWTSPLPAGANYSRPNFGPPATGSKWAFTNLVGTVISGNQIMEKKAGNNSACISLAQIPSYDGVTNYKLDLVEVTGNNVQQIDTQYNIYLYEKIATGLRASLIGNSFNRYFQVLFGYAVGSGSETFGTMTPVCFSNFVLNSDQFYDLTQNSTTPSVDIGQNFQCVQNTSTSITQFTGGFDGKQITIRLDSYTTLVNNASYIKLKGGTNVTGATSNNLIGFKNVGGVWFETWRNF